MKPVILFVDDEPNIIRGLRRFTRIQRDVWDMLFVESGHDAIELMARTAIDVIVSDMRMPEVTGADLLEYISQEKPGIIRIILSGEAERTQTYRTVGRSHRFLAKPCDPKSLIAAIDLPLAIRSKIGIKKAAESASVFDRLQSPPSVFMKLEQALNKQDVCINNLVEIVKSDPSLSARVLQLANSAYFGRPLNTCDVKRAIQAIGKTTIRDLLELNRLGNAGPEAMRGEAYVEGSQCAGELAEYAAQLALSKGANENVVNVAYAAGLFSTLGSSRRVERSDIGVGDTQTSLRAAYITSLLGMPQLLIEAIQAMSTLNAEVTIGERAERICTSLLSQMAEVA